jgi:hypothetical protein
VTRRRWRTSSSSSSLSQHADAAAATQARGAGYTVPVPAGWVDRSVTTLTAPPTDDGYVPNVVVTRETLCQGMGLGGFADGYANLLIDQVSSYRVLTTEHTEVDGERALVRTVRWQLADEQPVAQLQAFCIRAGIGYAFVATAAEDGFAAAEPAFREVLAGLRFDEDAA